MYREHVFVKFGSADKQGLKNAIVHPCIWPTVCVHHLAVTQQHLKHIGQFTMTFGQNFHASHKIKAVNFGPLPFIQHHHQENMSGLYKR